MDNELIQKWVKKGIISQQQADQMLLDVLEVNRERRSNRFIVTISTTGAILLGTGAILFIASNWQALSSTIKVAIMLSATFIAFTSGYYLKYQYRELPRVGGALMFLGALLFGATIMLIAQIYHIAANHHYLIAIWLIGILPLVYTMRTVPIAALASALLMLWVGLFAVTQQDLLREGNQLLLFAAVAIALFGFGGLHYRLPGMERVARTYRIVALKVVMITLFLLTFRFFTQVDYALKDQSFGLVEIVMTDMLAFVALALNWWARKEDKPVLLESLAGMGILSLLIIFHLFPSTSIIYVIVFNLLFSVLILLLIYYGFSSGDIRVVNMGLFWLALFLLAKYFDWFWGFLDRAMFFLVGGVILVVGGIVLEKQRRKIKSSLGK